MRRGHLLSCGLGTGEASGGKRTEVILKYRKELQSLLLPKPEEDCSDRLFQRMRAEAEATGAGITPPGFKSSSAADRRPCKLSAPPGMSDRYFHAHGPRSLVRWTLLSQDPGITARDFGLLKH